MIKKVESCQIFFDGSVKKTNPGQMQLGIVIKPDNGHAIVESKLLSAVGTSNMAECLSLYYAVKKAKQLGYNDLYIFGDSKLVICAINREWNVTHKNLVPILENIRKELKDVNYEAQWISRNLNVEADCASKS